MVSLACRVTHEDGVTLVTGHVRNPDRPRRVRLVNQLDGPVWPPRCHGVPVAGWDGDSFECVLDAGEVRPVGYATPADPADDPLTVVATEPVDPESGDSSPGIVPDIESDPAGIVRALGSSRPPRDAVPTPGSGVSAAKKATSGTDAVESWFATVEGRIEAGETLAPETRVVAGADAVERIGGLEEVRGLATRLADDAARLRTIARRADALADRAETVEVPVEIVERLA